MGTLRTALGPPEPLAEHHVTAGFSCGEPTLDDWLRRQALVNQASGASRTFVVHEDRRVVGYYALAAGGVTRIQAPGRVRRNMPEPIPVVVLGRLAVDRHRQGQGLAFALLKDALVRCHVAASELGIGAVLVHALSEPAKQFYLRAGFVKSPTHPLTLFLPMREIDRILAR